MQTGTTGLSTDLDPLWRAVAHHLRVRKNDIHTPISFRFAERLCAEYPERDALVVRIAILLHDCGWSAVDESRIISEGFGPGWRTSDVRYQHEIEGCRIAREVLPELGYGPELVERVTAIIDGHDTRQIAHSPEDELVRDADRLWRFTPAGIGIACDWFGKTPSEYCDQLEARTFGELKTEAGRAMALAELAASRDLLLIGVL